MLESVEDFENTLNEMSTLKAPGVSGSRIKNLKDFFLSHVDEEDRLVSILINGCKKTPVSNKLGPLYVVDAIVRALIDEIGSNANVEINGDSPNGTAAAAVHKIQQNIETLLDDAIPNSNDDVKERISKLVDIWVSCSTFDKKIMDLIKSKYYKSFTPPGTPPKKKVLFNENVTLLGNNSSTNKPPQGPAASKDPTSVLQALANLAKSTPSPGSNSNSNTKLASPSTNLPSSLSPPSSGANDSMNSSNPNAIFQLLQNMNKLTNNNSSGNGSSSGNMGNNTADMAHNQNNNPLSNIFRDRNDRGSRSSDFGRKRDRSPDRNDHSDPKPTHVEGERNVPSNPHYRQKKAFIDKSIPQGCINVYSRTIFIGGVPHSMDEQQLVQTLKPYAEVQSVILNTSRKHAFVKVYSRSEAEQVIHAFSVSHPSGLRARWGVGFGPRDCCNYQTGVSTIPIQRLTDADKKWLVNAEWGGSIPELDLQPGLFVEEPDIEVGHGVSSKSISRKMPTNSSQNGPKSDSMAQGRYNNTNHNNVRHNNNPAPGNMPMNYGNYMGQGMPQHPQPGMMPYQQSPPQQPGMMPYQSSPYPGQGPPPPMQPGMMGSPPPPPFSAGGQPMDQTQMMAAMMSAMNQMNQQQQPQNGGNNNNVDMNSMLQVMASMMNGQKPPQPPQ